MIDKANKGETCRICEKEFEEGSEIIRHTDAGLGVPMNYTIHVTPKDCGTERGYVNVVYRKYSEALL